MKPKVTPANTNGLPINPETGRQFDNIPQMVGWEHHQKLRGAARLAEHHLKRLREQRR